MRVVFLGGRIVSMASQYLHSLERTPRNYNMCTEGVTGSMQMFVYAGYGYGYGYGCVSCEPV